MGATHAGAALASTGASVMVYGTSRSGPPPAGGGPGHGGTQATARPLHRGTEAHRSVSLQSQLRDGGRAASHSYSYTRSHTQGTTFSSVHASSSSGGRQLLAGVEGGVGAADIDSDGGVGAAQAVGRAAAPGGMASPLLGALCLTANCAAMAGYFVIARSISGTYPPIALTVRVIGHLHSTALSLTAAPPQYSFAGSSPSCPAYYVLEAGSSW